MITWNNVYKDGQLGLAWSSALHAQLVNSWIVEFMRVEMRINGHWLRPPVGMRKVKP